MTSTAMSDSLAQLSRLLRLCLRLQGGERVFEGSGDGIGVQGRLQELLQSLYEREPWLSQDVIQAEWAMDRETELARLEKENEELRRLLDLRQTGSKPNQGQRE